MSEFPDRPPVPPAAPGFDPSDPSPGTRDQPAGRRLPTVALVLMLLLVLAGGTVAGLVVADQRQVAAQWQDRALTLEEQRDGLVSERDQLAVQLDQALGALDTSERDVAALEERVLELAEEKARAEDTATTVEVERDVFIELSELIVEATGSLDACVSQLFELQTASVEAFNRANRGQTVDIDTLNARAGEVTRFCDQARSAAASAQAAADRLRSS